MNPKSDIQAGYLAPAFNRKSIQRLIKETKKLLAKTEFDTIAFRGMSGAMVAPVLALALNKQLLLVRKPKTHPDEHHSHRTVEGNVASERYIILDDLRSSGGTVQAILTEIRDAAPQARCIGVVLYYNFLVYGDSLRLDLTREMYNVARSSIVSDELEPKPPTLKIPIIENPCTLQSAQFPTTPLELTEEEAEEIPF